MFIGGILECLAARPSQPRSETVKVRRIEGKLALGMIHIKVI
jgi:hypothetical protein